MRVRMRADLRPFGTIAGLHPPAPGELFDVPEDEARRMAAAGQASLVDEPGETRSLEPLPTPWAGARQMVFPDGGPSASGDIGTDGRALTGRTGLARQGASE